MTDHLSSDQCPVCGGASWNPDVQADRILGLVEPYRVEVCSGCGLGRLFPQLSLEDLKSVYDGSYFNSSCSVSADVVWQPPELDYATQVVPERLAKFSKTLQDLCQLAPKASTLLDVGAATGDMVKLARDSGLVADGLEFSEFASRQAFERYGIELMNVPLSQLQQSSVYDIIHLNHVFEHFNEPRFELEQLHRLLKPGGLLYIEVPLQFHLLERIRFWLNPTDQTISVHSLHHPFFYTTSTLHQLLNDTGFKVLRMRVFDNTRYPSHSMVHRTKRLLWRLFSVFKIGNFIEIIAQPLTDAS